MADIQFLKIADGTKSLTKVEAEGIPEFELYFPSSIEELKSYCVNCDFKAVVRIYYAGTISEWKKIKKGHLEEVEIKSDWYGYYYHNVPYSSTYKKYYYNWISSENVTIICTDGTIQDDKEENKLNPQRTSSSSRWDD